jgi:hypothetical protein
LEQLAKHLVLQYPKLGDPRRADKGWEMWFFHSVFEKAATGFLEERLKSQRRKLVPVKPQSTKLFYSETTLYFYFSIENPEPDESLLLFMSQNKGEEVKETMRLTVFQRRSLIRTNGSFEALEKLLRERMPRLLDVEGMVIDD